MRTLDSRFRTHWLTQGDLVSRSLTTLAKTFPPNNSVWNGMGSYLLGATIQSVIVSKHPAQLGHVFTMHLGGGYHSHLSEEKTAPERCDNLFKFIPQ